jgi:hypothetical protein
MYEVRLAGIGGRERVGQGSCCESARVEQHAKEQPSNQRAWRIDSAARCPNMHML